MLEVAKGETATKRKLVEFFVVDESDGKTPENGEAGGQPQISRDGVSWTNSGIGTLSLIGNGRYVAELTDDAVGADAELGDRIRTRYRNPGTTAECPGDTVRIVSSPRYDVEIAKGETDGALKRLYFTLVQSDGITPATGEAGGQPQISRNGGSFGDSGIGVLVHVGNGLCYAELTDAAVGSGAADGDAIYSRYKSAATAECPGDTARVVITPTYYVTGYSDEVAVPAALEFPTEPVPSYPLEQVKIRKTTVTQSEDGTEKRVRRWPAGRTVYNLRWEVLSDAEIDVLWDFYESAEGSYRSFVLYDPYDGVTSLGNFRFVDDNMTRENFEYALWNAGLSVIEVL